MELHQLEEQLFDIYLMHDIPFWQKTWFLGLCVGLSLILLFLVSGAIYVYKKRRKKVSPWEKALHQLSTYHVVRDASPDEGALFYVKITATLKMYFTERYGVHAADKTDQEFLQLIQTKSFSQSIQDDMNVIFSGAQEIKFAKETALNEHMERALQRSIDLVKKTIPDTHSQL